MRRWRLNQMVPLVNWSLKISFIYYTVFRSTQRRLLCSQFGFPERKRGLWVTFIHPAVISMTYPCQGQPYDSSYSSISYLLLEMNGIIFLLTLLLPAVVESQTYSKVPYSIPNKTKLFSFLNRISGCPIFRTPKSKWADSRLRLYASLLGRLGIHDF